MCRVIIAGNQKGGVAKTTTVANLGIGLARHGKRVLLIDGDAQGSLTASLGHPRPDEIDHTLATVLGKTINEEEIIPFEGILRHPEGVSLLPGNIELSGVENSLVNIMSREFIMREYVESMRPYFDYILIDCPPSLGMVTINALVAADSILIPVQANYLSAKGLEQLVRTIRKIKKQLNPSLTIEGILMTMVNHRTVFAREIIQMLKEGYGNAIGFFETSIPESVKAAECAALGVSIYKHDPKGRVAIAYDSQTKEVLAHE